MMQDTLQRYADEGGDAATMLTALIDSLRPEKPEYAERATHMVQAFCRVLETHPALRQALRSAILALLGERKSVSLYVDSGIQPGTGFFSELGRRVSRKILPDAINPQYLKDVFSQIFSRYTDEQWVQQVEDAVWLELLDALRFDEEPAADSASLVLKGVVDAVQVLSYRISAAGLEPELIRGYPDLEDFESPFITQNVETLNYLTQFNGETIVTEHDARQALVMLDQCRAVIARIKRMSVQNGTSISLTFLLQRLIQQIERQEMLLQTLDALRMDRTGRSAYPLMIALFKILVAAECHKNDLSQHWRENMELLALRVTENASRTGEHYITETRQEYLSLMRSAMGAGCIIAVMAMLKIIVAGRHLPPLTEAIVFSLNYGLGFMLIHILHFTVATKQPAMTAAAIAASISESGGRTRDMDGLVDLIAKTMRSQMVAIFGNVLLAVPVAMLIGWGIHAVSGSQFVSPEKAGHLLADVDPLHSGALLYAAIAGGCLFLSGLIAGYHDNLSIYNRIPQRLRGLHWLRRMLGERRLNGVARYIEDNLGALAGNFYFGCLLGGMTALGVLLGLPVDIRHIAFSSAYFGFSLVGLGFDLPLQTMLLAALGIMLIGLTNLLVSFSLALYVAMKSRKVTFVQWRMLLTTLLSRFNQRPGEFLLPPK